MSATTTIDSTPQVRRPGTRAFTAAATTGVRIAGRPLSRHAGRPAGCPSVRQAVRGSARASGPSPAAQAPRPAGPSTRLTARGRLAVVAALVLLLFAAFSLGRTGAQGSTELPPRAQLEQTTVAPGDTLWAVAQRIAPGQDPRPVVDQIRRLNDLSGGSLQAGQQLLLPVAP